MQTTNVMIEEQRGMPAQLHCFVKDSVVDDLALLGFTHAERWGIFTESCDHPVTYLHDNDDIERAIAHEDAEFQFGFKHCGCTFRVFRIPTELLDKQ